MSGKQLVWDQTGKKIFETGVNQVALYPQVEGAYPKGVAWSGITGITESPSGAEASALYADNIKYANLISAEELGLTIEAYTYPDEWAECDGSAELAKGVSVGQQTRKAFGLAYKTLIGNDDKGTDYGYKLHLVYGCLASPSEKAHSTVNDSPEAETMSWEVKTTPVNVPNLKPTASITIDSTTVDAEKLKAFEKILYGDESTEAKLPLPEEVATAFTAG